MILAQYGSFDRSEGGHLDIEISDDFAERGVSVELGVLTATVSIGDGVSALTDAIEQAVASCAERLNETPVAEWPAVATTRRAYRACGKDPTRYRASAEALLRRVAQGKDLYRINAVVDCNNLVSLLTGLSIGAYDAEKLEPPVCLRIGRAGETYEAIGRGPINLEGLPLLADRRGPFGSPTSDSARTMISPDTRQLIMVLYGFASGSDVETALTIAANALEAYAGARDSVARIQSNRGS